LLLSSNAFRRIKKDAFSSVAIAACINGQIATQNQLPERFQASLKRIIAITAASSIVLIDISDHQLAH